MKKILIVEDDSDINRALAIRLRAAGYDVVQAEDGYLGLKAAISEKPDLMLLDVSMPAGDGFGIVERMREHTNLPRIPFVILTASRRPELRKRADALGACAFFEKPFESAHLIEAIQEALNSGFRLTV